MSTDTAIVPPPLATPLAHEPGCALLPGLVPAEVCDRWRRVAEAHATSVRCRDVPAIDLRIACALLADAGVFERYRDLVGARPACNLDECWLRRQFPPGAAAPGAGPHSWHQDGALRHDFTRPAAAMPGDGQGLLDMLTCWIALAPCGSHAPGLELVRTERLGLSMPVELGHPAVARRFPEDAFWRPAMAAGDALLLRGDVLHRTHATPAMRRDRSSLELRFFDGERWPQRLAIDRSVLLDCKRPRRGAASPFGPLVPGTRNSESTASAQGPAGAHYQARRHRRCAAQNSDAK